MGDEQAPTKSLRLLHDQQDDGSLHALARDLVRRKDSAFWSVHLTEENGDREKLSETVVNNVIPHTYDMTEISGTIDAFHRAKMAKQLMTLLEMLVFQRNDIQIQEHCNIQNLLLMTAIESSPERVMSYIHCLQNFDVATIAKEASRNKLYEEAFVVYNKFKMNTKAIQVLIGNLKDLERAKLFAQLCSDPEVWGVLGHAQISEGLVDESLYSFAEADDHSAYKTVIAASKHVTGFYYSESMNEQLVKFLLRAREKESDSCIDETIILLFAHMEKLSDLKDFLSKPHIANLDLVLRQLNEQGMLDAAFLCKFAKPITVSDDEDNVHISKEVIVIDDDDDDDDQKSKHIEASEAAATTTTINPSSVDATSSHTNQHTCKEVKKAAAMDTVADILECKICLHRLTNPKTLTCQHMFCKCCLEGLVEWKAKGSVTITCPMRCKDLTKLKCKETIDDLGTPYEIKAILETVNNTSDEETPITKRTCNFLSSCNEEPCSKEVTVYCCGIVMCDTCLQKHNESSLPHQESGNVITDPENGELIAVCKTHKSGCSHVCLTCKPSDKEGCQFICMYCSKRDHKTHKKNSIANEANKLESALRKGCTTAKTLESLRRKTEEEISRCRTELMENLEVQMQRWHVDDSQHFFIIMEKEKMLKEFEDIVKTHLSQYPSLFEVSFLEDKLKKKGTELLLEKNQITQSLPSEHAAVIFTHVSLKNDQKSDTYLGELQVISSSVKLSQFDSTVSTVLFGFSYIQPVVDHTVFQRGDTSTNDVGTGNTGVMNMEVAASVPPPSFQISTSYRW